MACPAWGSAGAAEASEPWVGCDGLEAFGSGIAWPAWGSADGFGAADGVEAVIFLLILSGLFYAVKRKVWADAH